MKWRRTTDSEVERLTEERKALARRYTIDAAEAEQSGWPAVEAERRAEPVAEPPPERTPARPDSIPARRPRGTPHRPAGQPRVSSPVGGRYLLMLGCTLAATATYAANWHSPVRVAVTVVFLLFLPGLALAELAPPADAIERLVVGIGGSLAFETLVAVAFLYAGFFTTGHVFAVSLAVTAALATWAALRARRHS